MRTYTYLDRYTGRVLLHYDPRTRPRGERLVDHYQRQLHYGEIGGWPTRVLACLGGLSLPVLYATGVAMWWRRRRAARGRPGPEARATAAGGSPPAEPSQRRGSLRVAYASARNASVG